MEECALIEPLTKREKEVLALVAQGLSDKEISKRLCITTYTTKIHVHNIYDKLGCSGSVSRVRATLWYLKNRGNDEH